MAFAITLRGFIFEGSFLTMHAVVIFRTISFRTELVHLSDRQPIIAVNAVTVIVQVTECAVGMLRSA